MPVDYKSYDCCHSDIKFCEEYFLATGAIDCMVDIILVNNRQLSRERELLARLAPEPDLTVVGVANDGHMAIINVLNLQPNIVLINNIIPIVNSTEIIGIICQQFPHIKVLEFCDSNKFFYITPSFILGNEILLFRKHIGTGVDKLPWVIKLVNSQ